MAKRKLPTWTHPALYALARLGAGAANLFEVDEVLALFRRVGGVWASWPGNRARLARAVDNISWAFPDWSHGEAVRTAELSYRHLFALAAEVAHAPRVFTTDAWSTRLRMGDMRETIELVLSGRPCLMITGHCGNWEYLGLFMAMLGVPMHALYRPLDQRHIDDWLRRSRARTGLTLVSKFGASEELPRIIERAEPVGFIADQNAGDRGLFAPFFGRLASTYKTIGLLAMRYDAPIICGHAIRLGGPDALRMEYEVYVPDIIRPEHWKSQPDPLFYITARYRRAIETMVRRAPEQYLWMHRAWKSRPRHELEGRPFPPALRDKLRALPWMTDGELARIVDRSERDAREAHAPAAA